MSDRTSGELLLTRYVDSFESKYGNNKSEKLFNEAVRALQQIKFIDLDQSATEKYIMKVLYTWGRMGRFLGRKEKQLWHKDLTVLINTEAPALENFRILKLADIDLILVKDSITYLYRNLDNILGPVATGKTLNLICSSFFPLWDNSIAKGVISECTKAGERSNFKSSLNDECYFAYMIGIQSLLRQYNELLISLSYKYGRNDDVNPVKLE
jgi:hypothetical protein